MSKKIIQDILIVRKSIRMVKKSDISDGFFSKKEKALDKKNHPDDLTSVAIIKEDSISNYEYTEDKKHITKNSLIFLWIICFISIAVLLFILSSLFAKATLTITPKNQTITLNDTYEVVSDKNTPGLHYQVMTIKKDLSKIVETDGEESVERKAVGKAMIYNNFSTSNQRLINNTRLETRDGLTYRIRESVDIPGIKTINGVKTPGSVEVEIIADMPGDKYNMKVSDLKGDFTIPGFKGSTKYSTFYGRLSADVDGGFVGNVKKVSDSVLTTNREELSGLLTDDLIKEIYSKKPEQFVLFKDDYYIRCNDLPDDSTGSEYKISEECSINAIIFDKDELAVFIAKNKIKDFDNSKVDILWSDDVTVSLFGITERPWSETSLRAKFVGLVQVVWYYDTDKILSAIIGQDKTVINSIIENNKNSLVEIQATIRPMWKNIFPENKDSIKIVDVIRDVSK